MFVTITTHEKKKIIRFLGAGSLAALTEYGVFLLFSFVLVRGELYLANSIGFLSGLLVSFLLNKHWVFKSKKKGSSEFVYYFALAMVNLLISNLLIGVLVNGITVPSFVAKLISMGMVAAWNYFVLSRSIFKQASAE